MIAPALISLNYGQPTQNGFGIPMATDIAFALDALPFRDGNPSSPSYKIQHFLHQPVSFIIMPIFALANTGIFIFEDFLQTIFTLNTSRIFTGLFIGKPLGIVQFSFFAVKSGLSRLPEEINWIDLLGAGFLGGIGFTMSTFITILAFGLTDIAQSSQLAIMFGSLVSGGVGLWILSHRSPSPS